MKKLSDNRFGFSELTIAFCIFAIVLFFNVTTLSSSVNAESKNYPELHKQGGGVSYGGINVDTRLNDIEAACTRVLYEIGSAEYAYARESGSQNFVFLQELVSSGYMQPNASGRTLASEYSISFFIPGGKKGFTLIAEPTNYNLRPLMLTENYKVVPLSTTIEGDPGDDWTAVREQQTDYFWNNGYFRQMWGMEMAGYDTDLQVRLNKERSAYVIHQMNYNESGLRGPDDSFSYVYNFRSYMLGDTRD